MKKQKNDFLEVLEKVTSGKTIILIYKQII